jgi:hypothetical protein
MRGENIQHYNCAIPIEMLTSTTERLSCPSTLVKSCDDGMPRLALSEVRGESNHPVIVSNWADYSELV